MATSLAQSAQALLALRSPNSEQEFDMRVHVPNTLAQKINDSTFVDAMVCCSLIDDGVLRLLVKER